MFWFAMCSLDMTNKRHACCLAVRRFSCYSCHQASLLLTSMVRILFRFRYKPTLCLP